MVHHERLHARCACAGGRAPFTLSGTSRKYARARPFAIEHLVLDLALDFQKKALRGVAELRFRRVDPLATTLELDAVGFQLEEVLLTTSLGTTPASCEYDGDTLRVAVPVPNHETASGAEYSVRISYQATPRRGLYFLAPDPKVPNRPVQAWTQCQDEDARHIFPCHDKPHVKMTTELSVTVPGPFVVLSNGELVEKTQTRDPGGMSTYRFKLDKPHSSYLVSLVAGEFDELVDRAASLADQEVVVSYLVPPGKAEEAHRTFSDTPHMLERFSKLTGVPYPWGRYTQVVVSDFIFGGMENTTATTLYEFVLLDEKAAVDVSSNALIAHELAHQWFGNYVTCKDWSHAWLNEGFATYFEHVEREDRLGRDEYDYSLAGHLAAYLEEVEQRYQRPIVCRDYAEPIDLFDAHLYEKGGLVLHMLRRELGDELFWAGVQHYLTRHAFGVVETHDLERAFETVSGRSFERFFDQWVYQPGHPELNVRVSYAHGLLNVRAKQKKHEGVPVFAYPLEILVCDKQGKLSRHRKDVDAAVDALVVKLDERPAWVAFDPELCVMTRVTFEAPADMLRAQLASGDNASIRWRAAEALSRRGDQPAIEALFAVLENTGEPWMVRAEAARALGKIGGEASFERLQSLLRTEHPKVRRQVVAALGQYRNASARKALGPLAKSDASYLVEAEACRALGRTRQPKALAVLTKLVERDSWADVTRAGALEGLAELRDDDALTVLRKYTAYGTPTRGRQAAILALSGLSQSRRTRELFEDLLDDDDPHLRIDVVAALESLGDVAARSALRKRLDRELDGRVKRRIREALRNLGGSFERERRGLKDDLETLRRDLSELKLRLGKLEKHPEPEPEPEPPADRAPPKRSQATRKQSTKTRTAKTATKKVRTERARTKKIPSRQAAHGRRARSR